MKMYAQHGYAPADKISTALGEGYIQGVILSPRYLTPDMAPPFAAGLKAVRLDTDILMDPEFYAAAKMGTPNAQLGSLEQWPYFVQRHRNELLVGTKVIDEIIGAAFTSQQDVGCSKFVSPNIYISGSLDSIDAAIAISFISRAKSVAIENGISEPVYPTLAICKDALINQPDFLNFLNLLSGLEPVSDGLYVLIGAGPTDIRSGAARSELLVPEVLAGWMLLNYTMSINGQGVINGCSDIFTPLLGIARGEAGSTGWWSNLQVFSMGRYIKGQPGGQPPLIKYLSKKLLNRITITEREAYSEIDPGILNGLSTDEFYANGEASRTEEACQAWQALGSLMEDLIGGDIETGLDKLEQVIVAAKRAYQDLRSHGFSQRYESNIEYLTILEEGAKIFRNLIDL